MNDSLEQMENTIKQTTEEKMRALDSVRRLHHEYKPLKEQVNHLRDSIGLDKTDDNEDEELIDSFIKKLSPMSQKQSKSNSGNYQQRAEKHSKSNAENSHRSRKNSLTNKSDLPTAPKKEAQVYSYPAKSEDQFNNSTNSKSFHSSQGINELPVQFATAALMAHSLRGLSPTSLSQQQQQFQQHFNPFILNQVNINNEKLRSLNNSHSKNAIGVDHSNSTQQQQQQLQSLPPPFRQQPPPMKVIIFFYVQKAYCG